MHRFVVIDFSNVQHLLSWKIVTYCNLNAARQSPSQTDFWRTPWPAIEFKWQTNKISHNLHERGNIWKHPGSCSSNKHIFPATITLQPSLSHFLDKMVFFFSSGPNKHTNCTSCHYVCFLCLPTWELSFIKTILWDPETQPIQAVSHIRVGLFPAADSWSSHWPPPLWQYLQLLDDRKYNYITCAVLVPHIQIAHRAQLL